MRSTCVLLFNREGYILLKYVRACFTRRLEQIKGLSLDDRSVVVHPHPLTTQNRPAGLPAFIHE